MIAVEDALDIVLSQARALPSEDVALGDALGRVLAEDVASDLDQPPFDRAMMDGYALRSEDATAPITLAVIGRLAAGQVFAGKVGREQAVRIMTGAPLPQGADAVQQVEKTRKVDDGQRVAILEEVVPGQNVAPRASEVRVGETVRSRGETIDPAAIAVLASFGRDKVAVGRRPTVSILVTGDELVDVAETPGGAQIRNSNGPALLAQAQWAGAHATSLGVAPDQADLIADALKPGLRSDVLVVSGGVSAGDFDLVKGVFGRFGVDVLFTSVAIKPGAPLVFGRRGETLIFGLPGNPVSAQVTFDVFVRAALLRLQGARVVERPRVPVTLLEPARNKSRRAAYIPARVRFQSGRLVATPLRSMGSADVAAHARANALLMLPADRMEAQAGEAAFVLLLGNFLERDGA